jgi:hypothetical protein
MGLATNGRSYLPYSSRVLLSIPSNSRYGRNLDAWVDCMTSLDAPEDGLSRVSVGPGETLLLRIDQADEFQRRCPAQYAALLDCSAAVNRRRVEVGEAPILALLLV